MSQTQVLQFLQNNPKQWFTAKEIAQNLEIGSCSVSLNLKILRKFEMVEYIPYISQNNPTKYMHKENIPIPQKSG